MTTLYIVRHGNTFGPEDIPTRVGCRTDLALSESGVTQGKRLKTYFEEQRIVPDKIYSAELKRAQQTAQLAFPNCPILTDALFDEIDYGPDENQPEDKVIERIGQEAIDDWNNHAIVPDGWLVNPQQLITSWYQFCNQIIESHPDGTIFVFTSNGIARFAPHITHDFEQFKLENTLKLKTGALGQFTYQDGHWKTELWNVRP